MAHQLEANDTMFSARGITPWHRLGTVLQDPPSIQRGLIVAGLDWDVALKDLTIQETGELVPNKAVVRADTGSLLGVVGPRFVPLQNRDAFKVFEPLVESGDITLETAGSLRDNRVVWVLGRVNRPEARQEVGNGDVVDMYVLLSHGHDGTMSVRFGTTLVRVVCNNTMAMAHSNGQSQLARVKHTTNAVANLESLRNALDLQLGGFNMTMETFRKLARQSVNTRDLERFVRILITDTETPDKVPECENDIIRLFETGAGQELDSARGTAFGLYNAVTNYLTHERGRSDTNRLYDNEFGPAKNLNNKALALAVQMFLRAA